MSNMTTYKEKQTGFAPIIIVLIVVIGIGAIVGGGYYIKNKKSKTLGANISETLQEEPEQRGGLQLDEFLAGTPEDLVVNEEVLVRGTENQDGSITAEMIFIGVPEEGFRNMRGFSPDSMIAEGESLEMGRPPLPEGIDFEEFRNLSQEERMERMQEFRANAGDNFRVGNGRMVHGAASIRGEIIDKDEISITVKLAEGGSKLVFYSDSTRIMKEE